MTKFTSYILGAMALHSKHISLTLFTRIAAIAFIYTGAIILNAFYIQSIGSGVSIYSGFFHVTDLNSDLSQFFTPFVVATKFFKNFITKSLIFFINSANFIIQSSNKKLPSLIGQSVITIFIVSLISYLTKTFSINLMDPFYIKIFCITGLTIISFLALDYLFKYLICLIFRRYKNLSISNKLPKIVYNSLTSLKIISGIEHPFYNLFIINFGIYLIVLLLLASILILI